MLQHALNMDAACVYWAAVMPETGTGTEGVGPRAGRYATQLSGYRAFMPAPLPPEPPIRLEGDLRNLLSRADRMPGRLDGAIQTLPAAELFVFMYVCKEAVLSSSRRS